MVPEEYLNDKSIIVLNNMIKGNNLMAKNMAECTNSKTTIVIVAIVVSGYHADTLITIKAKANPQGQQPLSLIFISTLYNVS